jgi:hypothetical protein
MTDNRDDGRDYSAEQHDTGITPDEVLDKMIGDIQAIPLGTGEAVDAEAKVTPEVEIVTPVTDEPIRVNMDVLSPTILGELGIELDHDEDSENMFDFSKLAVDKLPPLEVIERHLTEIESRAEKISKIVHDGLQLGLALAFQGTLLLELKDRAYMDVPDDLSELIV